MKAYKKICKFINIKLKYKFKKTCLSVYFLCKIHCFFFIECSRMSSIRSSSSTISIFRISFLHPLALLVGWYQVERLLGGYPGLECPSIGAREDIGKADIDQTCCQTPWISQEGAWKKQVILRTKVNFFGSTRTCWSVES